MLRQAHPFFVFSVGRLLSSLLDQAREFLVGLLCCSNGPTYRRSFRVAAGKQEIWLGKHEKIVLKLVKSITEVTQLGKVRISASQNTRLTRMTLKDLNAVS